MTTQEVIIYMCRNNTSFCQTYLAKKVSADIARFTEVCNDFEQDKWDLVWYAIHELKYRGEQINEFILHS